VYSYLIYYVNISKLKKINLIGIIHLYVFNSLLYLRGAQFIILPMCNMYMVYIQVHLLENTGFVGGRQNSKK